MDKLLASLSPFISLCCSLLRCFPANAHRVFVTRDSLPASPTTLSSGNLTGIVSIVDSQYRYQVAVYPNLLTLPLLLVLSLFARLAKVPGVDPTRMQRHRRASSASSQSSTSDPDFINRSRSNSRTGSIQRGPGTQVMASSPQGMSVLESARSGPTVPILHPVSLQRSGSWKGLKARKDI